MDLSDAQILLLKTTANYLNSEIENYIRSNAKVEEIVARISDLVDTAASDIPTIKIDPKLGFSWLNKFLLRKGYLGKYFDSDFFPLKQISNINPDNYELAQDLVKQALPPLDPPGTELDFNPVLTKFTVPNQQRMGTAPTQPPPPGYTPPNSATVGNVTSRPVPPPLDPDVSVHPLRYQGKLPPLGTQELDTPGYSKLRELSKTINSKLPIESILERFVSWAISNDLRYDDEAYKQALGTVLPDAFIKIYDYLSSDKTVPFHHLAYLLSKKLGTKKSYKIARTFGEELACNMHDPPLKVLDEIETLFYSVENRDRKSLAEEAFLLAESFLTRRFGDAFWAIFSARLQAEKIDTIADLTILFKNHFVKVAQNFEEEKTSSKKTSHRLHHLEEESVSREQIQQDVKQILSRLDSPPTHQDRVSGQLHGSNSYSAGMDQGYYTMPPSHQNQCFSTHHLAQAPAPAPAPAPHPQHIVMPVVFPGNQNGGQRQSQGRQYRGNQGANPFVIPTERQYAFQACCYPSHTGHLNRNCNEQTKLKCTYNYRHSGHQANNCMRSRDWHFGAVEDPNRSRFQRPGNPGGRPAFGPRATPDGPQQRPPPGPPQVSGVNQIVEAIRSGFQGLSNPTA